MWGLSSARIVAYVNNAEDLRKKDFNKKLHVLRF